MERELRIVLSEEGAEPERVARLTGYLREELLQLDVDDVTAVPGGEPPPGARVAGIAAIGTLLVHLGGAATGLGQVAALVRNWWGRSSEEEENRPALRLSIGDDVLEISEATDEQVTEALDLFVKRHSAVGA
ncbi:hypothetical protein [Streptomyces sp. B93]|uniref:hypothetical protein n=1 Tax=Streptomyces sp. B93 TaxID=2824875 RepID=UPI001B389FE8|nr:hypothetical protein [Streptomyces sp. B93]MBQ1088463.1 hypothetical protein [Streptomyces sp. B93]